VINALGFHLDTSKGLLAFLKREATLSPRKALLVATVAGVSNALILAIVNNAAERASGNEGTTPLYVAAFIAVMAFYIVSQRWILTAVSEQIEMIVHRVRMRIMHAVKNVDFVNVERIGREVIYSSVSTHAQTLSQAASSLTIGVQMGILVFFAGAYLGYVSFISLVAMVVSLTIILTVYFRRSFSVRNDLMSNLAMDNEIQMAIKDMLDGLREAKLSRRKTRAILERIETISEHASTRRARTQVLMSQNFIFSQVAFYLLLAIMVFVVPELTETYGNVVSKSTTTVLFLIGPISGIVGAIPVFENASAAAQAMMNLEAHLQSLAHDDAKERASERPAPRVDDDPPPFGSIQLRGASFKFPHHDDAQSGFSVGPIDLNVRRGDIVFITGGNGSGKSTFLYMLLGLYPLLDGHILRDGRPVLPPDLQDYRELFTSVLDKFHLPLFLDGADPDMLNEADKWLELLEVENKTKIADGRFDTIDLSAGQRRRLGLVAAVLERRPIIVLDEWAADQDPIFRRKFYRQIIPLLRDRGHTIVAVTHDSRFFDVATQQLHMEYGVIADFKSPDDFHD
jgi:putative ATP-binding cassette transporter